MFRRHLSDTIRGRRHEPFRFFQGDMEVVAVDSGTGRKKDVPCAMDPAGFQHVEDAFQINLAIEDRLFH